MYNFKSIDWKVAIAEANCRAIGEPISRFVNSFGGWALDEKKQPVVFQVQITVKDIGGENTRTETDYYFVPTTQPDQAIAIAKAIATYNFLNLELPSLFAYQEEVPVGTSKAEDKVSQEEHAEAPAVEESPKSASVEQPEKKKRKPRTTKPKVEGGNVALDTCEPYDNTKSSHKDALISMLDREFSGWRDLGKERTKAMSAALVGQPFLSDSGTVVESFKIFIKKHIDG